MNECMNALSTYFLHSWCLYPSGQSCTMAAGVTEDNKCSEGSSEPQPMSPRPGPQRV